MDELAALGAEEREGSLVEKVVYGPGAVGWKAALG
jgi:hypothetical protein